MERLQPGSKLPAFSAESTGAGNIDSENLHGAPLVLYFYPKDNTPGCIWEGKGFRDRHAEFARRGVAVYGVSRDSVTAHRKFKAKYGFPFELIADADAKLCRLFGVLKQRTMFGRKRHGIERSTFLIDADGVLRREWRKVRLRGHVEDVLDALDEM